MTEANIKKIVREEITHNNEHLFARFDQVNNKLDAYKNDISHEFERSIGVAMEEFTSHMRLIAEYTQHMDENISVLKKIVDNHEHRLIKAGV